jgi:hypothetical protein
MRRDREPAQGTPRDPVLRRELLALAEDDERARGALAAAGTLWEGYHPAMEAVHRRNAARLRTIIAEHGWPGVSLVGADGAEAAWSIVQHAIGEPAFLRSCLRLLRAAAEGGEAAAWQAAMLEDRIRMFEGRPQRYATQLERDATGRLSAYRTEDMAGVDARRAAVGLEPLSERLARAEAEPLPVDRAKWEREYEAWLRRAGWRS